MILYYISGRGLRATRPSCYYSTAVGLSEVYTLTDSSVDGERIVHVSYSATSSDIRVLISRKEPGGRGSARALEYTRAR